MQYESYWSQEKTSYGHFFIKKHLSVQIGAYYRPDSTELYSQEYIIKAHSFSQIQQLHKCSAAKFWCHANTDWTQKLMSSWNSYTHQCWLKLTYAFTTADLLWHVNYEREIYNSSSLTLLHVRHQPIIRDYKIIGLFLAVLTGRSPVQHEDNH